MENAEADKRSVPTPLTPSAWSFKNLAYDSIVQWTVPAGPKVGGFSVLGFDGGRGVGSGLPGR